MWTTWGLRLSPSCDMGRPATRKANSAYLVLWLPLPLQNTSQRPAHQNQTKTNIEHLPVSKLPIDKQTCVWYRQILTHVQTQLYFWPRNYTGPNVCLSVQQAGGASPKDVRRNTKRVWNFATDATEFKEVSRYLQNGSGTSIQADNRPLCPFHQFHFIRTFLVLIIMT